MNLPLHFGLLGSLEAALIALLVGLLSFLIWHRLGARRMNPGQVLGAACLLAVAIGAGYDIWNLIYTCVVQLESPLYARMAFDGIHDPDALGGRTVLEIAGALSGVACGWYLFSGRSASEDGPEG